MENIELHAYLEQRRYQAESMREPYILQIKEGLEFYEGILPAPYFQGSSKFVDRTVYDQVRGITSQLSDTFMSSDSVVKFKTKDPQKDLMAKIATQHINSVILESNNGYNMLRSSIQASLKEKACYMIPYWVERCQIEKQEVVGLSIEELAALSLNESVEFDVTEEDGLFSGVMVTKVDTSGLEIDQVPFEQVSIDHNARIFEEANYLCRKINKIRGVLEEEGVKVHKDATFIDDLKTLSFSRNRDELYSASSILNDDKKEVLRDYVTVYEHYIKMKLNGSFSWWKIITDSIGIISKEEINHHGIVRLEPLPAPFGIYGDSIPDITKDLQSAMTFLQRGMFDNIMGTNHPQVLALKGAYDKRSLMNKQPNGIIEIHAQGAVNYVQPLPITNEVNLVYQMISSARDTRTGLSNAAQGLDSNLLTLQSSQ